VPPKKKKPELAGPGFRKTKNCWLVFFLCHFLPRSSISTAHAFGLFLTVAPGITGALPGL